jgi:aminopeptidase
MTDSRFAKLSDLLVKYSIELKKNERILLDMIDVPDEFAIQLMRAVRKAGAIPLVETRHTRISREAQRQTNRQHAALVRKVELFRMKQVQAYIAVRGSDNASESSDVPSDLMALYSKVMRPVLDQRVNKTRWCVLRWPSPSMAQAANMSTEAFENFYFNVCTMNYPKMARAMIPLQKRMNGALPADGKRNIPDGEVFTAPVKNSVQGVLQYNTPTLYAGTKFENVRLEFKDGKIIKATANNTKRLNQILDTDPGARYVGEFSLGFNPYIMEPMCDILFDEKIAGSLHFTPGQAYEDADNGNRSAVHWDMVLIQRPDWGGGEVRFDGELIRKDGLFLPKDLRPLNPKNLK